MGVADGAADNWRFLEPRTDLQVIDFYPASAYLVHVALAAYPRDPLKRREWLDHRCHPLKHEPWAVGQLLAEMKKLAQKTFLSDTIRDKLQSTITYFDNHHHQMDYAQCVAEHWPFGSGVTEAACKTLMKQRLCQSGMKWKEKGAGIILSLRALVLTKTRWNQFWEKVDQYGFPVAA